jgi:hypothetical protein
MNTSQNTNYTRAIVVVAIIILAGGAVAYSLIGKTPSANTATIATTSTDAAISTSGGSTPTTAPVTSTTITTTTTTTQEYKDGAYSATGSYLSPGGDEKIGVSLTLKDDVIASASVTPEPVSSEGSRYQAIFQQNFQSLVVGKNIADVHLTKVSGSSLTSGGFNQALATIEAQAKA